MVNGLTSNDLGKPKYELAVKQHEQYVKALSSCGIEIEILKSDEQYPDSCFIEDVALCTPHCSIITRPGAVSRRGETVSIYSVLQKYYSSIEHIDPPGTLEGGDVMMIGDHYYIGISDRTNEIGAGQLISILNNYGMSGSMISLEKVLHLKTGVAYIEENNMVVCGEFVSKPEFKQYNLLEISEFEAYAANCIWVNGHVIIPSGFPTVSQMIKSSGYPIIEIDMSEFQKLDGGLSCLSLRF
jgi:dimethylargininase